MLATLSWRRDGIEGIRKLRLARTAKLKAAQVVGKRLSSEFSEELESLKKRLVRPRAVSAGVSVECIVSHLHPLTHARMVMVDNEECDCTLACGILLQDVRDKTAKVEGVRRRYHEAVTQMQSFRQILGPDNPTTHNAEEVRPCGVPRKPRHPPAARSRL